MEPTYCLWLIDWPCRPLDWWSSAAAWAQAVLAAISIFAAGALPIWIAKRNRLSAADEFIAFADHLIASLEELRSDISTRTGRQDLEDWGHSSEWQSLALGAADLEINRLPNASFLPAWLAIRGMAARGAAVYESILKDEQLSFTWERAADTLDGYIFRTKNLRNDMVRLDTSLFRRSRFQLVHVE